MYNFALYVYKNKPRLNMNVVVFNCVT